MLTTLVLGKILEIVIRANPHQRAVIVGTEPVPLSGL